MKRIKLVVFFILGLFMLTSCSMFSHESFPSGPQIEEPGTNPDVEVSSYLITYYENGLKVHQESLESGKTLPQVESTKAPLGQEFMGWSTSKEEYVPVDFDVMPESDVDLYAFYQKVKYTITFNANISLPDGTTTTKEYEYHDRLGEFVPSDLQEIIDAQTDYVFVGWFLDSQFKEEFVEVSMPAEDIVLYAKWQFSGIRFMNGLEVFYEVKDDEGASVQAPLQNPTKPGYDFVGWVDAKGNAVSFPLIVTDEVQFIYAAFEAKNNMSYKVEHYLENLNGTFVRQEVEELFGSTDSEVEALWKSYTGFSKDETNENNVLKGIVNYNGTLVLKLYYSRNSYKVSFETNGGSAIQAVSYKYEQMVAAPSSPNKLGYTFAGWELNGESYSFTNMPAHDIELSAKWQVVEYTVTFVAAELVGKVTYTVENKNITEPAVPSVEHFTGAWEEYELTTGNITVKAVYTPVTYTVTFKAEGVTVDTENYTVVNPTITEPAVPAKEHYTGVWESYVLVGGNVEVEAVYTPVTYYVTFVAEGTEVAKLPYTVENTTIVEPAVPAKTGYTAAWESYSVVNGNITVNAVYTVNQYTISFNTNGGSSVAAITQNYGTTVVAPANPTKSGYVFKGWSPELPTVMGTENITVTAIWEELKSTSISFDTTDNRTSLSTTQQVWEQAGIIVTNNKNESTTNVADYSNPARFYKSSDVIIEYPYPIYEIVIEMSGGTKYYIPQTYTIDGAKLTVDDSVATYTLDTPSTSFTMSKLPNQVRVSMITIKTIETCKTYTIDFNSNGGSGSIDSLSDLSAAEVSIPSSTGLTAPTNMKFDSWNTSADGTGTSYQAGDSIVLTSDLTLYAIWVENDPVEMTISEALNQPDGTNVIINGAVQSINYAWSDSNNNMSVTIKDDTGTIYIFKLNTKVNLGDKVTITGTIGSYNGSKQIAEGATAVITGTVNVLITFDVTGGTGNVESMSVLLGSTIVLPDATSVTAPSGKQFKEWNSKEDGTGISYVAGSNYVALDNATIYAIWEDQNIVDDTKYFEKVTTDQADWSGTYLIVYEAEQFILNGSLTTLDAANNYKTVSIVDNKIEYTDALSAFVVVITKSGSSYTIKTASGYYIGNTADSNKLNSSTSTNYTNTITLNSDGTVNIKGSGGSYLRFNTTSGQDRFRYFKSTTYTNQKPVTLYKLS